MYTSPSELLEDRGLLELEEPDGVAFPRKTPAFDRSTEYWEGVAKGEIEIGSGSSNGMETLVGIASINELTCGARDERGSVKPETISPLFVT